jgi:hypothetical protein
MNIKLLSCVLKFKLCVCVCVCVCDDECDVFFGILGRQPNVQPVRAMECMDSFHTSLTSLI